MRKFSLLFAALAAAALLPSGAMAQGVGTVSGQVVDQATQQPIPGVQIFFPGTSRGSLTNQQGRFLIPNVPAGPVDIRATIIGYSAATQRVNVQPGATATANFALSQSAVAIEGVVVSAAGREERRREIGNAVSNINVADVELAAVNNMSSLLQGRSAGVSVMQSGGTAGSGSRIRIRGSNSVSLSNEPLLVVDGVRVNNAAQSFSIATGGQAPSRLNDLNPEDIETIEILKGPAAAALYGTAAANGVIQVTTKRGRAGGTRWAAYTEAGDIREVTNYRDNVIDEDWCTVFEQAEGFCTPGVLHRDNPFHDPELRPFVKGNRRKVGMNVSGGSDQTTFYLSGETDQEQGIFAPNNVNRLNLRANMNTQLTERLNVAIRTGWVSSFIEMPQNDNNFAGVHLNGNLGYPRSHPDGGNGWYWQTPEQIFAVESEQEISRLTGGVNVNFQPLAWLSLIGTAGLDQVARHDQEYVEPGISTVSQNLFAGTRRSHRAEVTNITTTLDATGRFALTPVIASSTSIGTQFHRDEYHDTRGFGVGVVPGTRSLGGTTRQFGVNENTSENATFGAYLSQQLGFSDRLFLTAAVRGDKNSAFGTDIGWVAYPSLSASWVLSEEPFFPATNMLSSVRLRSSLGRSGLRPTFRDAITYFDPSPVRVAGSEVPGITLAGAGNPELRPEISTEFEIGFDTGFMNDRFGFDVTYYNKQSQDAMVRRRLAPSLGATTTRFENIGSVSNVGFETLLNARLVEGRTINWDATATFSRNRNTLEELGVGIEPIIFGLGSVQRHVEGFPLGGYWGKPMTWQDANNDGLAQRSEVTESDDFEYLGTPFPTREASFSTGITLLNTVRLSGLMDYKGGHKLYNFTRGDRCAWEMVCEETYNAAAASISDQLGWIGFNLMNRNVSEFIEDADFVKLRELSASFMLPDRYLRPMGVSGTRLTISGRNLHTWTRYSGYDPEVNTHGQDNFSTADYHNQPPVRFWTARLDLNF
ncbi:SusC/RagA family TonB-linked outer membrane protein [soil metagenome]